MGEIADMLTLLASWLVLAPTESPARSAEDPLGVDARIVEHLGDRYRVVTVDLGAAELGLVGQAASEPHTFEAVRHLPDVVAATNASLFHELDEPVGLWVQEGRQTSAMELADGRGNFFLKPNGVFAIDGEGARVLPSEAWAPSPTTWTATQSGPLLVSDGTLHPKLDPQSSSKKRRNAVGVVDPWTVVLVASEGEVRFHDLATLFRDVLGAQDALFLDGTISGMDGPGFPEAEDRRDVAGFLVARARTEATGLQEGDVVFQRSRSQQSEAIALATGSRWTHTGLVRIVDGEPMVLEAVQPVSLTPFAAWRDRGVDGEVLVRRHVLSEAIWTEAHRLRMDGLQAAWLGRDYDLRFEEGTERLYCSELVRQAYLEVAEVELVPLRPVSSYDVADPGLREAMVTRWGKVPEELLVVAPSDLAEADGWMEVSVP